MFLFETSASLRRLPVAKILAGLVVRQYLPLRVQRKRIKVVDVNGVGELAEIPVSHVPSCATRHTHGQQA